jgi:hypothetical protein
MCEGVNIEVLVGACNVIKEAVVANLCVSCFSSSNMELAMFIDQ